MLIISRHQDETIVIDAPRIPALKALRIVLTAVEVRGEKVRIGIEAPRWLRIRRGDQGEHPAEPQTPETPETPETVR